MRRAVLACAVLALALACGDDRRGAPAAPAVSGGARAALGGPPTPQPGVVRSLRATSNVRYVSAPDRPHALLATFAPDRARVELRLFGGERGERRIETRHGDRVGLFAAGYPDWQELEGEARAQAWRRLELRRALLAFPDGFEWSDAFARSDGRQGVEHRAPLEADLGELVAVLDAEGYIERFAVLAPDGREQEALRVRRSMTVGDRLWPRDLELEVDGVRIWTETVLAVQPGVHFRDAFFLPGDEAQGGALADDATLVPLPEVAERRVPLDTREWSAALERAVAVRAAETVALEPGLTLELDADGRPAAVLLRARDVARAGDGFVRQPQRRGASLVVSDFAEIARSDLARLTAAAADDGGWRVAGPVYARELSIGGGERRVQVVLPLEPADG